MAAFGIKAIQPQDNEHIFGFATARGTADMALLEVWNGPTQSDLRLTIDKDGQIQGANGTAARPTYSYEADKDSGRYMSGAGTFLDVVAGTAVGTWTAGKLTLVELQIDNLNLNGNTLSSTAGTDLLITPLSGQQIVLDGVIVIDAGVVTGATSITSDAFVGPLTGTASVATLATSVTATANNTADETVYPTFVDGATGTQGLETDTGLTYNPSSGLLTATAFAGALTGAVTGTASVATVANTVVVVDSTDTTSFIAMFDSATGSLAAKTDGGLLYNAGTGMLTATGLTGPLTGLASTSTLASTVVVVDSTDTSSFIAMFDSATGSLAVKTDGGLTYNSGTGMLTATGLTGPLTGLASTSTLASTVVVVASSGDTSSHIAMFDSASGSLAVKTDPGLTYDADTNILTAAGFAGPLVGAVTGTASVATTVTVTDNESTNENNLIAFVANAATSTGAQSLEMDGNLNYNPSTGKITATLLAGDLTGDVTGNADTATALETARTIGGTSFDGSANIAVALATLATTVTITDNESTSETNAVIFTAGGAKTGGNLGLESDGTFHYNPSSGTVTATLLVGDLTGDVTGALTGTASVATTVTVTDNVNENENNCLTFVAGADQDGGNVGLESDAALTYNPYTNKVTATGGFVGALTGAVTGAVTGTVGASSATTGAFTTITASGAVTVGTDGSGTDVYFYSATSGDHLFWDASEELLTITGTNGQTALNVADGNVTVADTLTATNIGAFTASGAINFDSQNMTNVDVDSGTIDGTTVGAASASTGAFTTITGSGVLSIDDTTDSTSTTSGSIHTDGGVGIAKDLIVGDDLTLISDAAVLNFGVNSDVSLTHVHNTGLLLNSTMQLQFNDSSQYISGTSATVLSIAATDEIDLTATAIDLNGTLDVSGTLAVTGAATLSSTLSIGSNPASAGAVRYANNSDINVRNAANGADIRAWVINSSDQMVIGASGVANYSFVGSGATTLGGNLIVSGTGPHAIGGAVDSSIQLKLLGAMVGIGAFTIKSSITGEVNGDFFGVNIDPTFIEAASGTHAVFANLNVDAPSISNAGASITQASTVRIAGAPTVGTASNAALYVVSGATILGGDLTATQSDTGTATHTFANSSNSNVAAHLRLGTSTGGSSGGDPFIYWIVTGQTDYYMGIDNSDSDKLKIGDGSAVGSNTAIEIDTSQNVTIGGDLVVSGTGPHAIGGAVVGNVALSVLGNFTSSGAGNHTTSLDMSQALTGSSGRASMEQLRVRGSITTSDASATIAYVQSVRLAEPAITKGSDTITVASTLMIENAPSEGTTNAALYVAAGPIVGGTNLELLCTSGWNVILGEYGGYSSRFTFDSSDCILHLNETVNTNMTIGLTINQEGNDDQILCFKSSDVDHDLLSGYTSIQETDDYFIIQKTLTTGGVELVSFANDAAGSTTFNIVTHGGTATTTDVTSSNGLINMFASEHNGSNALANNQTNGNLLSVAGWVGGAAVTHLLLKGDDGELHLGNTTLVALDDEDDIGLVRAMQYEASGGKGMNPTPWNTEDYGVPAFSHEKLMAVGVLGEKDAQGRCLMRVQPRFAMNEGAIWQNHLRQVQAEQRHEQVESCLRSLIEANPHLEGGDTALALLEAN